MTTPLRSRPAPVGVETRGAVVALVALAVIICGVAALTQTDSHLAPDRTALLGLAARVVAVLGGAGVLGHLLLCLCRPRSGDPAADPALVDSAAGWALIWTAALIVGFTVELADPGADAARLRWLVPGIALAAVVRVLCAAVRTRGDVGVVLGVAVGGLAFATTAGHEGSGLSPTSASLFVHVLAASAWIGGLLALVVHVRNAAPGRTVASTARAYSRIALVSYVALAGSGALALIGRTDVELLGSSGYGALALLKVALLLVLGLFGAAQRRTGLRRLDADEPRGFLLLSVGELATMATAVGLGVTLAHTAP